MTDRTIETVGIADDEAGQRLDRVLAARIPALSRSRLKALILSGQVALDGRTIRDPAASVNSGATVRVTLPAPEQAKPEGETIPLTVVYEDDALIVIDKPAGLVVHPGGRARHGNAGQRPDRALRRKPVRHRRRQAPRHRAPARQGHQRADGGGQDRQGPSLAISPVRQQGRKRAGAWLSRLGLGRARQAQGHHRRPLDRHRFARGKRAVREGGRAAVTHWQVLERFAGPDGKPVASLLACTLDTGRTHQIRVHLAHIGHPILGDATYGTGFKTKASRLSPLAQAALEALRRQALHAYRLAFEHPASRESMEFVSELAADMAALRGALSGKA